MLGFGVLLMTFALVYGVGAALVGATTDAVLGQTRDPRNYAGEALHKAEGHILLAVGIGALGFVVTCLGWAAL